MDIGTTLVADDQASQTIEPGEGAFDHPAIATEPFGRFDTSSSNSRDNAAPSTRNAAASMVVGLVRMELRRTLPRTSPRLQDRWHFIQHRLERKRVVDVGRRQFDSERDPFAIHEDVVLGARFAAIGWVRSGRRTPLFAGTLALSNAARLQSIRSARPNSSSSTRCSRSQTPANCQSLNRRQQVMPLPHPISWGKSSQGIPVFRTNTMPFKAKRSGTRGRPPFSFGGSGGRRGSILCQSSSGTNSLPMVSERNHDQHGGKRFC